MVDSSVAGRLPGVLPVENFSRQAPENGATIVAPEQSVRPLKELKELRNKDRNAFQEEPGTSGQSEAGKEGGALPATPDFYLQGVDPDSGRIYLKAVDPKTGHVYWQVPRPSDAPPGAVKTPSASPAEVVAATPEDNGSSTGLLGGRAYGTGEQYSDGSHRIDKTA